MNADDRVPLLGMSLRMPPANLQAEHALLGALLANNRAVERVEEFLLPEHFADPVNAKIYSALLTRIGQGKLADAVTLRALMEGDPELDAVGGARYLAQLLGAMVGIINVGAYGRAIHDSWVRRQLIELGEIIVNEAFDGNSGRDGNLQIENAESRLYQLANGVGDMTPATLAGDAVKLALAGTRAAILRESPLAGITSGIEGIDQITAGLQDEQLILLGARPSIGKSALGLTIAARAARAVRIRMTRSTDHNPVGGVLFWSGEMSREQIGARLAAAASGISSMSVFTGRHTPGPDELAVESTRLGTDEMRKLARASVRVADLPLHLDTRPGMTVAAIRSRARRMQRTTGLDLIVIDYVGLLRGRTGVNHRSLYERMTEVSADLMSLKAELRIPVLALVQLSRQAEGRDDKMPRVSDLRDSGAFEQDANLIMLLHRPYHYLKESGEPAAKPGEKDDDLRARQAEWRTAIELNRGKATLLIPKNRNGPTGTVPLLFDERTTWFRDAREPDDSDAWEFDV